MVNISLWRIIIHILHRISLWSIYGRRNLKLLDNVFLLDADIFGKHTSNEL